MNQNIVKAFSMFVAIGMIGFCFPGCAEVEDAANSDSVSEVSLTSGGAAECCGKCAATADGETATDCCGKCKGQESAVSTASEGSCCSQSTGEAADKKDCCGKCEGQESAVSTASEGSCCGKCTGEAADKKDCCGKCEGQESAVSTASEGAATAACPGKCNACAEGKAEDCVCEDKSSDTSK